MNPFDLEAAVDKVFDALTDVEPGQRNEQAIEVCLVLYCLLQAWEDKDNRRDTLLIASLRLRLWLAQNPGLTGCEVEVPGLLEAAKGFKGDEVTTQIALAIVAICEERFADAVLATEHARTYTARSLTLVMKRLGLLNP